MKKTEMKVSYSWKSLGLINGIKALWPSKTKKYLMKWAKTRGFVDNITFYSNKFTGSLSVWIDMPRLISDLSNPWCVRFKDALEKIALIENMRNVEELCIWLDMRDAA